MIRLTQEEQMTLVRRTASILSRCDEERNWKEVLADAYCEFMLSADVLQGRLVAQHILNTMSEFEAAYDVSKIHSEAFIMYYLDTAVEGKDLEGQCRSLHVLIESMRAFNALCKGAEVVKIDSSYNGPFTEKIRNALRVQAETLAAEVDTADLGLEKLENILRESNLASDASACPFGERAFRSISAMVLYTMAVNHELNDVPSSVSIRQVTYTVCVEDSMRRLIDDVEKEYIDIMKYHAKRMALWQILKLGIVTSFVLLGGGAVAAAIAQKQIAGAIVAGFTAVYGIAICLGPMDDTMHQMIESEDITIHESSIPVYSNADRLLSAYDQRHAANDCADFDSAENDRELETPNNLIEEI